MSFRVKFKSKEEFLTGLKFLKEIGALGTEICVGTYLPDSENVDDILSNKIDVYENNKYTKEEICEFSIGIDIHEYRNKTWPDLYGKDHIMVGLTTKDDIKQGDVFEKIIPYKKMIEETLKLIQ